MRNISKPQTNQLLVLLNDCALDTSWCLSYPVYLATVLLCPQSNTEPYFLDAYIGKSLNVSLKSGVYCIPKLQLHAALTCISTRHPTSLVEGIWNTEPYFKY